MSPGVSPLTQTLHSSAGLQSSPEQLPGRRSEGLLYARVERAGKRRRILLVLGPLRFLEASVVEFGFARLHTGCRASQPLTSCARRVPGPCTKGRSRGGDGHRRSRALQRGTWIRASPRVPGRDRGEFPCAPCYSPASYRTRWLPSGSDDRDSWADPIARAF